MQVGGSGGLKPVNLQFGRIRVLSEKKFEIKAKNGQKEVFHFNKAERAIIHGFLSDKSSYTSDHGVVYPAIEIWELSDGKKKGYMGFGEIAPGGNGNAGWASRIVGENQLRRIREFLAENIG